MRKKQRDQWLAQTTSACRLAPREQKLAVLQASIASLPSDEQVYAQGVISLHAEGITDPTNAAPPLEERTVVDLLKMMKLRHIAGVIVAVSATVSVTWHFRGLYDDIMIKRSEAAPEVPDLANQSHTESIVRDAGFPERPSD